MTDADETIDAFERLGQRARVSIVRALLEKRRTSIDPHLAFSELRDAAGIEDTGRFNYHLDRLVGTYVRKTDEGYRLSSFGHRVLAPMASGMYDPERSPDPIDAPGECHECGGPLRIRPRETVLQVVCTEGHVTNHGLLGYPGVIEDRTPGEAVEALALLNNRATELGVSGVCPTCHGATDGSISAAPETDAFLYTAPCDTCGNQFATTVGSCAATHPDVVAFLADDGVDVRRAPPWTFGFRQPGAETIVSEEPVRFRVDVRGADGVLAVTVDRDGSLVSTERSKR